jgi:hypothetical protein
MKVNSQIKNTNCKRIFHLNFKFNISNLKLKNAATILKSQEGIVLAVSLLLLLVATVAGITALSTSTTNVMIAGNRRLSELNFSSADSGAFTTKPVINDTAFNGVVNVKYLADIDPLVKDAIDFAGEIGGGSGGDSALDNPDIGFSLGADESATTVFVDVDYLYAAYAPGSAIEFASGYDGLGKGAGAGGAHIFYNVNSVSQGEVGSETEINAVYRYVTK